MTAAMSLMLKKRKKRFNTYHCGPSLFITDLFIYAQVPEDLQKLTYDQQQRALKLRSAWMMLLGTAVTLLVSDPMVDVLSDLGTRTHIKPFYVAFVLAPMVCAYCDSMHSYSS